MNKTAYITHPDCIKHEANAGHPEQPERLRIINRYLARSAVWPKLLKVTAPLVERQALVRTHDADFVQAIFDLAPSEGLATVDEDTFMNAHSLRAAQLASGAVVKAVDMVMQNEVTRAFCAVRPPGHHAEINKAMGFCLFNNIAVGAYHAICNYGLKRIAVIDFDVHHGNGSEDIFKDDPRVLFCSSFEHPQYPFSGVDCTSQNIANIPLSKGTGSDSFRQHIREHWLARLDDFAPELIFISAGFDAHKDDPLGGLELTEDDYAWLTQSLGRIADKHSQGRIVSALEGGYNLEALARSVVSHITSLTE